MKPKIMKKKRKKSNSVNPTTSVSVSSLSLKHNYKVNNSILSMTYVTRDNGMLFAKLFNAGEIIEKEAD